VEIEYKPKFKKQYAKLPTAMRSQFKERLKLLLDDPTHPQLRIHALRGKYAGYLSMNVSGDIRAVYKYDGDSIIIFFFIGTHSQLYG